MEREEVFERAAQQLRMEPYEIERLVWPFVAQYVAQWLRRYVANGDGYAELWLEEQGGEE